jgi:hypothetical protein
MRDTQVECTAQDRALVLDRLAVTEFLPQPERYLGQQHSVTGAGRLREVVPVIVGGGEES